MSDQLNRLLSDNTHGEEIGRHETWDGAILTVTRTGELFSVLCASMDEGRPQLSIDVQDADLNTALKAIFRRCGQ